MYGMHIMSLHTYVECEKWDGNPLTLVVRGYN